MDSKRLRHLWACVGRAVLEPYYFCPSCLRRYLLQGADPALRYDCPRCRIRLMPQMSEQSLSARDLETRGEALPEDVLKAVREKDNIIGKFIRLQLLGRGATGSVWKCYDRDLGRVVAVKFLEGVGEATVQRFFREARIAARLEHPNIARVYEVGTWQTQPYIVMHYVEGSTPNSPMELRDALRVILEAARAIHYAHEQGVIHRDIKSANILVAAQGEVYVLDFGLARELTMSGSISAQGAVVGTPPYMSPEQIRGESHRLDARSDVYSLGATLYELIAGRPPFVGNHLADFARRVLEEDPKPIRKLRPGIPWEVDTILSKCMDKDPARRYQSAAELGEDSRRFLAGEPILARHSSRWYRIQKRARRHPILFLSAAGVLATVLCGGMFWLGAHLQRQNELARVLEEGWKKLESDDVAGAQECAFKARQIDDRSTQSLWNRIQEETARNAVERARAVDGEAEKTAVEPLLRVLEAIVTELPKGDVKADLDRVMREARTLVERHPGWGRAWQALGWSQWENFKRGGSRDLLNRALQSMEMALARTSPSQRYEVYNLRSLIYANLAAPRLCRFRIAAGSTRIHRVSNSDPEAQDWLGKAKQDLNEARRGVKPAAAIYTQSFLDFAEGRYREAIERLEREPSGSIDMLVLRALCYWYGFGDMRLFREVELAAGLTQRKDCLILMGEWYGAKGDVGKSLSFYERALQADVSDPCSWVKCGLARARLGLLKDAAENLTRAIQLSPELAEAFANRGAIKLQMGEIKEALKDLDQAVRINPEFAYALGSRAIILESLSRHEPSQARDLLRRALADYEAASRLENADIWQASRDRLRMHLNSEDSY